MVKHIQEGLRVGLRATCPSEHLCASEGSGGGKGEGGGASHLPGLPFLLASSPLHANAARTHLSDLMDSGAAF